MSPTAATVSAAGTPSAVPFTQEVVAKPAIIAPMNQITSSGTPSRSSTDLMRSGLKGSSDGGAAGGLPAADGPSLLRRILRDSLATQGS